MQFSLATGLFPAPVASVCRAALLIIFTAGFSPSLLAATITVINDDRPGQGFNDNTPRAATGGNPGATLGARRLFAFQFAADILGEKIESDVEIRVLASFAPLQCSRNSATLGQAGAQTSTVLPTNDGDTLFPIPLANALSGRDLAPPGNNFGAPETDIGADFNGAIDNNNSCLNGVDWYYGVDGNPPGRALEFLSTVTHELIHGLGFTAFTNLQNGRLPSGNIPGIFDRFIRDLDLDALWPDLTAAQRQSSATNTGRVVWDGPNTTANGAPTLTSGTQSGRVLLYTPSPREGGSSVSHWDTSLLPNAIMEPFETRDINISNGLGLSTCFLQDIGWELSANVNCPDDPNAAAPVLVLSPESLSFGNVVVGEAATLAVTVRNQGSANLIIQNLVAPGAPFALLAQGCSMGTELAPNQSCNASIRFSPQATEDFSDMLGLSTNAGSRTVVLSGSGEPAPVPVIEVTPVTVDYGLVEVGNQSAQQVTVRNTGNAVLSIGVIGPVNAPFAIPSGQDNCSNSNVAAGAQCVFSAVFAPTAAGSFSDTVAVPSNAGNASVSLSGGAQDTSTAPQLAISPASVAFGSVNTGESADARITVSNDGSANLQIQNIQAPSAPFSIIGQGCTESTTLQPATSCSLDVRFSPASVAAFSGQVQISSDGGNASIALSGDGVATPVASVQVAPQTLEFGERSLGSLTQMDVTVTNTGNADLLIGSIGSVASPFAIPGDQDSCSGQTLAGSADCAFSVTYEPIVAGFASDNLTVPTNDQNVTVAVSGTGRQTPEPNIEVDPSILEFGDVGVGSSASLSIVVRNTGSLALAIGNVPDNEVPTAPFSIASEDCSNRDLAINSACEIEVVLNPQTSGAVNDSLDIASNDPENPNAIVQLRGNGRSDEDVDGVPNSVEDAAPNDGDGNNDGMRDALQPEVVSLPGVRGGYATLATDNGRLLNVRALEAPSRVQLPDAVDFNNGFFEFTVDGITPGSRAQVTIILSGGSNPDSYYKYREEEQGATPAVRFDFDAVSGTGAVIEGNQIVLNLRDGGRGDADLTADGQILDPGGPGTASASGGGGSGGGANAGGSSSGGGGGGGCVLTSDGRSAGLLFPLLLLWALGSLLWRRRRAIPLP